jgi:hypothetical protein
VGKNADDTDLKAMSRFSVRFSLRPNQGAARLSDDKVSATLRGPQSIEARKTVVPAKPGIGSGKQH